MTNTDNISNAVALLRSMPEGSLEASKIIQSLSAPELNALESVDDLESLVGGHANNIKHAAHIKKYIRRASISLVITRTLTKGATTLTNGNAQQISLPAPCFGVLEDASAYTRVLSAYLPQDQSIGVKSVANSTDGKAKIITFQNNLGSADIIEETVTIAQGSGNPYPNLLRAMLSMKFDIIEPKMMISDVTKTSQFDQVLNTFTGSAFTNVNYDSINPQEYKTDILSDNTVRIFRKLTIHIKPEKTLVPMIVAPTVGTTPVGSSFYTTLVCDLGITHE
ncbi:MAG: hypothetical protein ACHQII_01950 [Bacteroidia bacterium]